MSLASSRLVASRTFSIPSTIIRRNHHITYVTPSRTIEILHPSQKTPGFASNANLQLNFMWVMPKEQRDFTNKLRRAEPPSVKELKIQHGGPILRTDSLC